MDNLKQELKMLIEIYCEDSGISKEQLLEAFLEILQDDFTIKELVSFSEKIMKREIEKDKSKVKRSKKKVFLTTTLVDGVPASILYKKLFKK